MPLNMLKNQIEAKVEIEKLVPCFLDHISSNNLTLKYSSTMRKDFLYDLSVYCSTPHKSIYNLVAVSKGW